MRTQSTKKNAAKHFLAIFLPVSFTIFLILPNISKSQGHWGLEFRPGADFATKKLGDANLKTGFGFEGTVKYYFVPSISVYAGWSWNKFAANQSFAGTKNDFEETGYTFGLQLTKPLENENLSYLLEAGGIFNHIEIENSNGDIIADPKHGLGWQAGAGLVVRVGESFRLVPTIRYRSLSRDIKIGDGSTPVDLNYISAGVGIAWQF